MNHNVKDQLALPPVSSCPSAILSPTAASTISKMQKVCYALFFFFIEEQWVVICIYPLWYVVQETVHAILNIREMTGKFSEAEQHCHTPLPFKRLHYGHFHCKYELYFCFISLLVTLSVHSSSDNDLKKIQFKV